MEHRTELGDLLQLVDFVLFLTVYPIYKMGRMAAMFKQNNPGVLVKHAILELSFYLKIRDGIFKSAQMNYFTGCH